MGVLLEVDLLVPVEYPLLSLQVELLSSNQLLLVVELLELLIILEVIVQVVCVVIIVLILVVLVL